MTYCKLTKENDVMTEIMCNVLFMLVLFFANAIQTITGFAGNLLAMPPSMKLIGVDEAKTVINIFTMVACLIIAVKNREYIQWKILGRMLIFMLAGMGVGVILFDIISIDILLPVYGIMIILIALKKLFIQKEIKLPGWFMIAVLFLAGIIHGMFLSGGALLVVYAVTVLKDKNQFRATVAPVWVILDAVLIFSHYSKGFYTKENLILIVVSMIPLLLSVKVGNYLYSRINQKMFMKITYVLLIISGIVVCA